MSFAADAIGFYLQLDNQLSPELQRASSDYERFVKSLDKWNTRAYKSASKGFGALTDLVASFTDLPKRAVKSYREALSNIRKSIKPITQPLILELSPKGEKALGRSVARAVSKVLGKTTIRLTATAPLKRSKLFDTSIALRQAYKDQTQPPDMRGVFQGLPKFQKGGLVPGPGGIDEILALLTPGEAVLPADVVKELQSMAAGKEVSKSFSDALANITNLATAAEKLKDLAELGLDPKAQTKYNTAMGALNESLMGAREHFQKMTPELQKHLLPAFKKATGQVKEFREEGEDTVGTFKNLLQNILGPTRFAAIHRALGSVQDAFGGVRTAASEVADEVGISTDATKSMSDSMFEANKKIGMTRDVLYATTEALVAHTRALHGSAVNADEVGRAYLAMTEAGETNQKKLMEFTPLAATTAKAFGTDAGGVAETIYRLNDAFGLSRDEIAATFTSFGRFAKQTPLGFEQFRQKMMAQIEEGGLGAFLKEVQDPSTRKTVIEQFGLITGAMAQNWGEAGGEMAQLMSQALTDPKEYGPRLLKLTGLSVETLRKELATGRGPEILEAMSSHLSQFAGQTTQMLGPLLEALEFQGTPEQFKRIAEEGGAIVDTAKQLRASIAPVTEGMSELTTRAESTRGAWTGFKDSVGLWFSEKFGIRLSEFFDDFNPQVIVSTGYLVKMGVEAAVAGSKLVVGLGGGLLKIAKSLGSAVGLLGKASKGVTALSTGAGTAAKAAGTGGFLTGLAGGLMALAPALSAFGRAMIGPGGLGLLALVGVGFAIAGMARVLAPAIKIIGEGIGAVLSPMFDALKSMSAGQIVATAGALLVLGPSFGAIGAGVFAMSAGLVAAVPGMAVFAGVMAVYSAFSGGKGFGGMVDSLLAAFKVDQTKLDAAVHAMGGIVLFTGGLMAVAATMAALGVGSVVANVVGGVVFGILGVFGVDSPMEALVHQAKSLSGTVSTLVSTFNLQPSQLKRMEGVQKTLETVAAFTGGYAEIAKHLKSVTPGLFGGLRGGILGIVGYLGVGSPMRALRVNGARIVQTLSGLADAFLGVDMLKIGAVQKTLELVAKFTGDYSKIASNLQGVTPAVFSGNRGGILGIIGYLGGGSAMNALAGQAKTISGTLNTLVTDFKLTVSDEAVNAVIASLKLVTPLVEAFAPLAAAVKKSGDLVEDLVDGWFFDGTLKNLADNMPSFSEHMGTIVTAVSSLRSSIGGMTAEPLKMTIEVATSAILGITRPVAALKPLADAMKNAKEHAATIVAQRGPTVAAIRAAVTTATNLKQEFSRPIVARGELEQTVRVELDPSTSDKPVHDAIIRSNELLVEIATAIRGGGAVRVAGAGAGARARPRVRGIDPDVAGMATGDRF